MPSTQIPLFCSDDASQSEALPLGGRYHLITDFWAKPDARARLESEMRFEERSITLFGRRVLQPRLVAWASELPYSYSGDTLPPRPWGSAVSELLNAVNAKLCEIAPGAPCFNHVLANLYRDGQDSMGLHADDEPELGDAPWIASVSLGAKRCFQVVPKRKHRPKEAPIVKLNLSLPHGSLLFMEPPMQRYYLHGLQKMKRPVGARLNLTFRAIVR